VNNPQWSETKLGVVNHRKNQPRSGLTITCVGHGFVQGSVNFLYAEVTGSISDRQGCPG